MGKVKGFLGSLAFSSLKKRNTVDLGFGALIKGKEHGLSCDG